MKQAHAWKKAVILLLLIVFIVTVFTGCGASKTDRQNADWREDLPENHEMNAAGAQAVSDEIAGDSGILSFLAVKDGCIVGEQYAAGYGKDSAFQLYSVTKSFTSVLVGIAIDQGFIRDVGMTLGDYFPELQSDPAKAGVTIENLLTMTSGFEWSETAASQQMLFSTSDSTAFALDRPVTAAPGSEFNYDSASSHLLSAILQKATGISERDYAKKELFIKIGITNVDWYADRMGVTYGSYGLNLTARDAARFGLLLLNQGKWENEQVIPAQWIKTSTQEHPKPNYGYLWRRGSVTADKAYDMFYADGKDGQAIFIVPELNLTAVFTGNGTSVKSPLVYFTEYVNSAFIQS